MAKEGYLYYSDTYSGRKFGVVQGGFSINGYVEIKPSNDPREGDVEVHGCVTFKGYLTQVEKDRVIVTINKIDANSKLVYGFDTAHFNDEPYYSDEQKESVEGSFLHLESLFKICLKDVSGTLVGAECKQMIDDIVN